MLVVQEALFREKLLKVENIFFLIINIQVPGSTTYSLVLYFMVDCPIEDFPLLDKFVEGDNAFRNSRFKLIPYISKGSWIVKKSVGKNACLIGQALEINYFHGKNYLEVSFKKMIRCLVLFLVMFKSNWHCNFISDFSLICNVG